ncbi:hypothetical protein RJ639_004351 [Escallonia herrerae]|uniref:F-box domain-containing protein n=1 Tax=Escallonia herrerae TaxID=1293975 RepID=A0AA89AW27_9ASTE|nr:hypothetical protein RJ639_004351 [Escallonia herrerae]
MSDYIPHELLVDILVRLPVKSFVRCTSVCKSWHSLLTSRSFIAKHLNRSLSPSSTSANKHLVIVRSCYKDDDDNDDGYYSEESCKEKFSVHHDDTFGEYSELHYTIPNKFLTIIGCIDGLVCLSDDINGYRDEMFLWNPSIRKVLPLHPLRVTFSARFSGFWEFRHTVGFGFDPLTSDYKVVRVVYRGSLQDSPPPEVDIYSLNRHGWRDITSRVGLRFVIKDRAPQAFVNGAVHWLGTDREGPQTFIVVVSFDMGDEMFRKIEVPGPYRHAHFPYGADCAVYKDSLAMIDNNGQLFHIHIWAMMEYGRAESWAKVVTLYTGAACGRVIGIRRNGDVLFLQDYTRMLTSFDPEDEKFHSVGLFSYQHRRYQGLLQVDNYVESLVSLGLKCCDEYLFFCLDNWWMLAVPMKAGKGGGSMDQ